MPSELMPPSALRRAFSSRLSVLYADEVPLYGQLTAAVKAVNREVIRAHPALGLDEQDLDQISEERHGAIRLGRPDELRTMADFFAVLGMQPVNFYDLSAAGAKAQPVIATAFRPTELADIEVSPFRVFCSLLRPDDERFFDAADLRRRLHAALAERDIFTPRLRALIATAQAQGGLDHGQADAFLHEGVRLFAWRGQARDRTLYDALVARKLAIAADICCFPNPHLNHLTPNTLDIDALQARMQAILAADYQHLQAEMKDHIEGPPRRRAPILLRQTSYKALTEAVTFDADAAGAHTARFGEIEQRGLALTPEGRHRYDAALARVEAIRAEGGELRPADLAAAFAGLPDDVELLRQQGLGYFSYAVTDRGAVTARERLPDRLDALVAGGFVSARPIRYEDFLPVSAAGIFASNLRQSGARHAGQSPHRQQDLEAIMERPILDAASLYAAQQDGSLAAVQAVLGVALS
jgi:uncharacterized glyoxalase superfamily metalloenzyme YdcJ